MYIWENATYFRKRLNRVTYIIYAKACSEIKKQFLKNLKHLTR